MRVLVVLLMSLGLLACSAPPSQPELVATAATSTVDPKPTVALTTEGPRFAESALACKSESALKEMNQSLVSNDKRATTYLLQNGCFFPQGGIPISLLDRGFLLKQESGWREMAHVRAYLSSSEAVELWTYIDDLDDV